MATRAQVDSILSEMLGARAAERGGTITGDSPISFWSFPIFNGLRSCGIIPEDIVSPTDNDVGRVTDAMWEKFIDFCYLRGLISISSMPTKVTKYTLTDYSQSTEDDIVAFIESEKKRIYDKWGKPENEFGGMHVGMIAVRSRRSTSVEI
jgi:hypothetical protein